MADHIGSLPEPLFRDIVTQYVSWESILRKLDVPFGTRSTGVVVAPSRKKERTPSLFCRPYTGQPGTGNFVDYSTGFRGDKVSFIVEVLGLQPERADKRLTREEIEELARFFEELISPNWPRHYLL